MTLEELIKVLTTISKHLSNDSEVVIESELDTMSIEEIYFDNLKQVKIVVKRKG